MERASVINIQNDGTMRCRHDIAIEMLRLLASERRRFKKTELYGHLILKSVKLNFIIKSLRDLGYISEAGDEFEITKHGLTFLKEYDARGA